MDSAMAPSKTLSFNYLMNLTPKDSKLAFYFSVYRLDHCSISDKLYSLYLEIGGVAISTFVGDWRTTPFVCNSLYMDGNSRREKFNWAEVHPGLYFINIECAEPAPEGKAVKIYLNYTTWVHLYEIEIHGRSLLGKCYYFMTKCINYCWFSNLNSINQISLA